MYYPGLEGKALWFRFHRKKGIAMSATDVSISFYSINFEISKVANYMLQGIILP